MEHFLLKCTILQAVRYSVLDEIDTEFNIITGKTFYHFDSILFVIYFISNFRARFDTKLHYYGQQKIMLHKMLNLSKYN
jgi:hypothetical protein